MLAPADYFDLSDPAVGTCFDGCTYVWEALDGLGALVRRLVGETTAVHGEVMAGATLGEGPIFIGEGARIEPGAYVVGPAYIGAGAVVRHGAFVRENVVMLAGSLLGHASEAKNSLFLPGAHAPHFNYVGDSILGHRANLGAGTKLSNLTVVSVKDAATGKRPTLQLNVDGRTVDTGRAKLGAILGDDAQTGCNSVLNPGVLLGPRTLVYANAAVRKGVYPGDTIIKLRQTIVLAERRNS